MPDFDIEQVNKVRLAMGMKPLPVPGAPPAGPVFKESNEDASSEEDPASTYDTRQAAASSNWQKLQEEQEAAKKKQARKDAIRKAQETAQRFAKLEGKGLADDDEVDTKSWLIGHKKKQAKLEKARKLEKELLEREQQAQYTAEDLAGVKVGHELNEFDEGGEQILTLKDAAVDAESEDDELENVHLRDREKLKERLEAKKKKPMYDPNNENGEPSGILAQYDEEIDGKKRKNFTLDSQGTSKLAAMELEADSPAKSKGVKVSLDILKDYAPISDYKDAKEVKIKKPKKSKSKSTKRKALDDDDIFPIGNDEPQQDRDINMADSSGTSGVNRKRSAEDANFVDDEDLQANLAMQRRAALKKRKKMKPEDLARLLKEEEPSTPGLVESIEPEEEPGLVIDETSEFVANLQKPTAAERRRPRSRRPSAAKSPDADGDVEMEQDQSYNEVDRERSISPTRDFSRDISTPAEATATGLDDEASLSQGMGATISMLKQRGILKNADGDDLNAIHRDRQRFLADRQKREADAELRARQQRERDRKSGKLDSMSAREREAYAQRTNAQRDQMESRQLADIFNREYKPDVQLKYIDEYGRNMTQKEAFKHLSHQFHGKGSGKQKTEKRMKKIEEEKRKEAMSVLDASQNSTNMNTAVEGRAKRARQAGVRLQ